MSEKRTDIVHVHVRVNPKLKARAEKKLDGRSWQSFLHGQIKKLAGPIDKKKKKKKSND
jgi:hypothetical protein